VSVWSQKDAELADIEKEKEAQARGPESRQAELKELQNIYIQRGQYMQAIYVVLSSWICLQALQVLQQLHCGSCCQLVDSSKHLQLFTSNASLLVHNVWVVTLCCGCYQLHTHDQYIVDVISYTYMMYHDALI
jgi:hypothetical protein